MGREDKWYHWRYQDGPYHKQQHSDECNLNLYGPEVKFESQRSCSKCRSEIASYGKLEDFSIAVVYDILEGKKTSIC
ncbi:Hypothetical predicted protein [Octopus vulgaris]|uniref:Uncharacterized protein n=1 Tax=Octopus vulgaris TaxID=6645 RepID=A0AA36F5C4_OCTVU|nr:Hypothetical predicted protein [Octopus vulgaris]